MNFDFINYEVAYHNLQILSHIRLLAAPHNERPIDMLFVK